MKVSFYSRIDNIKLFSLVGFYKEDIAILRTLGEVYPTNNLHEILRASPDLIFAYFYSYSLFAALIGKFLGSTIIITGGADQISPSVVTGLRLFLHRFFAFICLFLSDYILVSCTEDQLNFQKLSFGMPFLSKKIVLSNHIVKSQPLFSLPLIKQQSTFHCFSICWMGTVENVKRKGLDLALQLVWRFRLLGIVSTISIAGVGGVGQIYLEQLASDLGILSFVKFLGPITTDQKVKYFASNLVYLQLSTYEGFGVAAVEALLSGMIVVHSNKGGLSDHISVNGIIFDLESFNSISLCPFERLYCEYLGFCVDIEAISNLSARYSPSERLKSIVPLLGLS